MNVLRACTVALLVSSAFPHALQAQFPVGGPAGDATGWAPVGVGARVGYDNAQSAPMVGAVIRIPVVPSGSFEFMPNADITFLDGFEVYQLNLEAVYMSQGRRGGFYSGGGIGFRNGVFAANPNDPRTTERVFSIVVGGRFGGLGWVRPEFEVRFILQDEQVRDPRTVMAGVSVPLW
jgi:hypothetical protein